MSSYYKRINGVNYDKAMLETADKSVKGKGDGKISLGDAKTLIKNMKDGGKVTETELRTLNYILMNYKVTETALKYIEDNIVGNLTSKDKESPDHDKTKRSQRERQPENKSSKKPKKKSKIKYLIILLLFIALIIFLLISFFCKKDSKEDINKDMLALVQTNEEKTTMENTTDAIDDKNLQATWDDKETSPESAADTADITGSKNNILDDKANKNKYVVKKNDTLTKISRTVYGNHGLWNKIYNANKDKIRNPNLIHQGQVLIIPEKTD